MASSSENLTEEDAAGSTILSQSMGCFGGIGDSISGEESYISIRWRTFLATKMTFYRFDMRALHSIPQFYAYRLRGYREECRFEK